MLLLDYWKPVAGNENYEVSVTGTIRRLTSAHASPAGRVMRQRIDQHGYFKIALRLGSGYRHAHVHRIMAETFIGLPPSIEHEVAHGDGLKTNIRLSNLRWATPKENMADRSAHGRWVHDFGEKHPGSKLTVAEVIALRAAHYDGGEPIKHIANRVGRPHLTVYDAITGKTWRSVPDYLEGNE